MNKKKWRRKFAGKDSRRWLKHHSPKYSAPVLGRGWQLYVNEAIQQYPELQKSARALRPLGSHKAPGNRPTETITFWSLPRREQKMLDAVTGAIFEMKRVPHGNKAILLIKYLYWEKKQQPSLKEAADFIGVSLGRARNCERMFQGAVARRLGKKIIKRGDGIAR